MEHLGMFIADRPDLKRLSLAPKKVREMLKWANKERYISLTLFNKTRFYSSDDLVKAEMWAEKLGKNFLKNY